ncbi:MAG: phage tail tape measure protein [[Clostridium] scindens]
MGMIAAGAQNGLDYSGELLDSISEYSVQFDKVGLDADDMFSIFQKGAETGAFNLDKVGDAVKEMSIRVVDGSDTTREGFETIGLNADEMASKFAAGGDSAKEAFQQTINALADMEDPLAQNTAGVDLFGTMWEDLGPEAVTALADIQEGAYDTGDAMGQIQDIKYDDLGSQFEELKRNVELLLVPIGEALIPLFSTLIESVLPVVTELLGPLISAFSELLGPVVTLISSAVQPLIQALIMLVTTAIQPLMPVLNALMGVFQAVFDSISGTVSGVIGNITNIFRNLIDFVNNVFSGNWKGAWENVKEIFRNAVDALVGIFKAPINAIVDGWNSLADSIGSVDVPDWVPIAGGKSFSLPKMSRLKIGMDYVPNDMFPAWLDEGEAVLTKEENALLRSYGGLEGMAAMIGRSGRDSVTVNVQSQSDIDYAKLGNAVADAMIAAGVGFKCEGVVFARLMKDMIDYV